jgi:hypothetical protein
MKSKGFLVVFIFCLHANLCANKFNIGFSTGIGRYSLVEMKELQNQLFSHTQRYIPGLEMTDQFPGYHNFSGWIEVKIDRHSIGYNYAHLFTGARNNVSDYSGRYNLDLFIECNRHSASYKFWILDNPQAWTLSAFAFARLGITHSRLDLKENFEIYNLKKEETKYRYAAAGKFLELGVGSVFKIFSFLEYNVTFGYDIDFSKDFRELDLSRKYLQDNRKNNISPDWSGIRFTMGLSFLLGIN